MVRNTTEHTRSRSSTNYISKVRIGNYFGVGKEKNTILQIAFFNQNSVVKNEFFVKEDANLKKRGEGLFL